MIRHDIRIETRHAGQCFSTRYFFVVVQQMNAGGKWKTIDKVGARGRGMSLAYTIQLMEILGNKYNCVPTL